ncbi:MAG: LemA family protein [Firmicutes bacterium HGW-Firmicutes-1]|jgi:LemA protein|nr:MAG: LemA family protein [Firmicutes bacterium HGW-Firmicutes-1]
MKTSTKVLIGIGVVAVLFIFSIIGGYNNLVSLGEEVEASFSQIDNQLQRRNDLIPNLVDTVKKYASHEEEIFLGVAEARAKLAGATTVAEQAEGDAALNSALGRLLAIAEAYPDLKSNQNFIQLQDELAGTENRIATARMDYNNVALTFNKKIKRFPTLIYAGMLGFDKAEYFEASEDARTNVDVGGEFDKD